MKIININSKHTITKDQQSFVEKIVFLGEKGLECRQAIYRAHMIVAPLNKRED